MLFICQSPESRGWGLFREQKESNHAAMKKASDAPEECFGQGVSRTGLGVLGVLDRCGEPWWAILGGALSVGDTGMLGIRPHHSTSCAQPEPGTQSQEFVTWSEARS